MSLKIRYAFISILDGEVRGAWQETTKAPAGAPESGWHKFHATNDACELWVVRQDGLRRAFRFKAGAVIGVGQMMVMFDQKDVIDELKVDEDEKEGKPRSPTVVETDYKDA